MGEQYGIKVLSQRNCHRRVAITPTRKRGRTTCRAAGLGVRRLCQAACPVTLLPPTTSPHTGQQKAISVLSPRRRCHSPRRDAQRG